MFSDSFDAVNKRYTIQDTSKKQDSLKSIALIRTKSFIYLAKILSQVQPFSLRARNNQNLVKIHMWHLVFHSIRMANICCSMWQGKSEPSLTDAPNIYNRSDAQKCNPSHVTKSLAANDQLKRAGRQCLSRVVLDGPNTPAADWWKRVRWAIHTVRKRIHFSIGTALTSANQELAFIRTRDWHSMLTLCDPNLNYMINSNIRYPVWADRKRYDRFSSARHNSKGVPTVFLVEIDDGHTATERVIREKPLMFPFIYANHTHVQQYISYVPILFKHWAHSDHYIRVRAVVRMQSCGSVW